MRPMQIVLLLLFLLFATVGVLFTVQNYSRTVDLSFWVGFTGAHLSKPAPVPILLWIAFGIGLTLGGGWGLIRSVRVGRERNKLKAQVARANLNIDS